MNRPQIAGSHLVRVARVGDKGRTVAHDAGSSADPSLGAAPTVVQGVAHRAAELAHAVRESFICVARPVLEQLDQGEHLARVANLDRSARPNSGHLRGDRLRRRRLQGARLQLLADTPGHFDLAAADREGKTVDPFGHNR